MYTRPPRRYPTSWSILQLKSGKIIYLHPLLRVSTAKQLQGDSPGLQLAQCRRTLATLQNAHPDIIFVLDEETECLVRRHDDFRCKTTQSLLELSKQPGHYVIVADGHPHEEGRRDVGRVTRDPRALEELLESGCKIITASNPYCRRSDLLEEAKLSLEEYNRNRRNRGEPIMAFGKITSIARQEASRRNGMKNRITAKARWKGVVQTVRFIGIFSKSAADLSRRLGGYEFTTPEEARITKTHIHRLIKRRWLKEPPRWSRSKAA